MIKYPGIKNEEILLAGLCRLDFNTELAEKLREVAANIESWEYFISLANKHGILALVYYNLENLRILSCIPAENSAFLKNALLLNIARNISLYRSLERTLDLLNRENIRTVLLKGMALELMIYKNAGLRLMSDADVLVPWKDSMKAYRMLISEGYIPTPVKSVFHKFILPYTGKHLPTLIKGDFAFEIHNDIFGKKNDLTVKMLNTSTEITLSGKKALLPNPKYLFLHSIKHIYLHEINNDSQLKLYADLVVLIEKYGKEIFSSDLIDDAEKSGIDGILASKLFLLREFWDISFPQSVNLFIEKFQTQDETKKFIFFLKSPVNNSPGGKSENYRKMIRQIPGLHRRFLYIIGDLFPSFQFMKNRYRCKSKLTTFLYYPHRIGKILWLLRRKSA